MISPLAYIHPEAKIGEKCRNRPFVFIDKNVVIGDNNTIMPNANILLWLTHRERQHHFSGSCYRRYSPGFEIPR